MAEGEVVVTLIHGTYARKSRSRICGPTWCKSRRPAVESKPCALMDGHDAADAT